MLSHKSRSSEIPSSLGTPVVIPPNLEPITEIPKQPNSCGGEIWGVKLDRATITPHTTAANF
jgi:hypothetical protein